MARASIYCNFHPTRHARWHCKQCRCDYCSGCMPDADPQRQQGQCPQCGQRMTYSGAAGEVEPFWQRIGHFFLYPMASDSLILIVLCTLVPALLQPNLLGGLVSLGLMLALLKYSYSVILNSAHGQQTPPPLSEAFSSAGFSVILRQMLVLFLIVGLIILSFRVGGSFLGVIVLAFMLLALPASIAQLTLNESVADAVNPLQLALLMLRIGWPYMVLYAHLVLLLLAAAVLQDFALEHFPPVIAQPLAGLVSSYFLLIFAHMLGYVLYQFQGELGFSSELDQAANTTSDPVKRLDADIDINLKQGNYDQVQRLLLQALKRQPTNDRLATQLLQLIQARQDTLSMRDHHRQLIPALIRQADSDNLSQLLLKLRRQDPDFRLSDPDLSFQCAQLLFHQQQYRLILWLLKQFHQRFPNHPDTPRAYLLLARTLADGLQQYRQAGQCLAFIHKHFPQHPLHPQLPHYAAPRKPPGPVAQPGGF
ncbi:MAG: hypothetical protein EA349_08405, partial [Halomonadaceae bacterium]